MCHRLLVSGLNKSCQWTYKLHSYIVAWFYRPQNKLQQTSTLCLSAIQISCHQKNKFNKKRSDFHTDVL